jgi:phenylacetate-CoA ligase
MADALEALKALPFADRLGRRNPLLYDRALATFRRLAGAPLEERRSLTEAKLRRVLRAATRTRYGRAIGAGQDIREWPWLEKAPVRDDPTAFAHNRRLAITASTSGTTGVPLTLYRSLVSVCAEQAAIDTVLSLLGVEPAEGRLAILRADTIDSAPDGHRRYWRDINAARRRLFSSRDLSSTTIRRYADGLAAYDAECLFAYPSSLEALCLLLQEYRISVRIPATLTSSEVLPDATRHLATEVLETKVADLYGQAERVALAYSLHEEEYRFLPGYGYVELVHTESTDDSDLFEVVGTSLWNLSMPLVRYRTGDLIALARGATPDMLDEVRFGVRPFRRVIGRTNDYLIAPDGARIVGMNHIPRGVKNIVRMQIVQEDRHHVRVLVLPKGPFGDDERNVIRRNLDAKLHANMHYTIETAKQLERSSAARTPFLIIRPGVENEREEFNPR